MSENTGSVVKKKNKIWKILTILIVLGLVAGGGYYVYHQQSIKHADAVAQAKEIKYEVLDESVLNTDTLKKWVEDNKKTAGVYSSKDDKFTYILISGGKQPTTGYGIALKALKGELKTIGVQYEVVSPDNPNTVEKKESYPFMAIRLPLDTREIKGELSK